MTFTRAGTALAVLAIAASSFGQALAQASSPVPDDLARAVMQWGICRGRVIADRSRTSETPGAIAEDALEGCQSDEAQVRAVAAQHYGSAGGPLIDQARDDTRAQSIALVERNRSGAATADPAAAWGVCIGQHAREGAAGSAEAGAVVDEAFAACLDSERKAQAGFQAAQVGEGAAALIAQARQILRDQAINLVKQLRRGR